MANDDQRNQNAMQADEPPSISGRVDPLVRRRIDQRFVAKAVMAAVEIRCPNPDCERNTGDPIPNRDGSFMWDALPETVKCPGCGGVFRVSKKIDM